MRNHALAASFLLLVFGPVHGADSDGRFMVKGAGTATCADFVAAHAERRPELPAYTGWIEGYLSAVNRYETETYDLAPWQSTELLAGSMLRYCERNPAQNFHEAAARLTRELRSARLRQHSDIVQARAGDATLLLYADTLTQVQHRLREHGHAQVQANGAFDEATRLALAEFQRENELTPTGLPDQPTLARLL